MTVFVEFSTVDGDVVALNPAEVSSITSNPLHGREAIRWMSCVTMRSGAKFYFSPTVQQVKTRLENAENPA